MSMNSPPNMGGKKKIQPVGSPSGGRNTSSPAAPSSSGLSWASQAQQDNQQRNQPVSLDRPADSMPAESYNISSPEPTSDLPPVVKEPTSPFDPEIIRFPNNFNFAQESDPEVYNQFELQKQRQSERLNKINQVYDVSQGTNATEINQTAKGNGSITTEVPLDDRNGNRAKYVYNKLLNGVGELAAAVGDVGATVMAYSPQQGYSYNAENQVAPRTPDEIKKQKEILTDYRKDVAGKVRSFVTDNLGAEVDQGLEAKYDNEFLTSSIGGLANSLPAMLLPAPIRTAGFILQGYDAGMRSLEANDTDGELDDLTKTIYATGVGTVGGLIEKFGFDKLVGNGTSILATMITNKALKESIKETGGRVTSNIFTKNINSNVKEFANRFAKRGINAAEGFLIEAGTGGSQEIMNIGAEALLNKTTGKPIFETKDMLTWDGFADNLKRVAYAAAQEGVGGGIIRGVLNPKARKKLDTDTEVLQSITDELENPELSPAAKEALVRQKIELQESIEDTTATAEVEFNRLTDTQKEQVTELGNRLDGVTQAMEDPNLSEDMKNVLQKQSDELTKQIEEIKPEVSEEIVIPPAPSDYNIVDNDSNTELEETVSQAEEMIIQMEQMAELETDPVEKAEILENIESAKDLIEKSQTELDNLKPKEDAVQKQKPTKVDVREPSGDGSSMEQGNAKPEKPTGETTPKEVPIASKKEKVTKKSLTSEENTSLDDDLKNEDLTVQDLIDYENREQTTIVPEVAEQQGTDTGTIVEENTGSEKVQGNETQKPARPLAEIEADRKSMIDLYHQALRDQGLYELAAEGKVDPSTIATIKDKVQKEYGKTIDELNSELDAATAKPKPVTKPIKSRDEMTTAEKIRALKTNKGRTYDSLLGVPVAIYDGALETIATAIEAGTSIKEAIKKAVAYIKKNSNVKDEALIESEINKSFEDAGITLKGLQDENVMPDVVDEIEKSDAEITQENIDAFKKNLHKVMTSAKTKGLIKTGVVKASLATDAMKKIADIVDRKSMLAASRAVKKVFGDIIRNAYISQIKQAKIGLRTRLKGGKLANTDLMKNFLKINESKLEIKDLEQYNALVRRLNDQYNARLDSVIADPELQKFVDYIADKQAKAILDEQITEAEVGEDTEAETKVSARRKQLEAAVSVNRAELKKGGYDPEFKEVATALINADTSNMSNNEMVNLNIALINLAVNNRLVNHEQVFRDYVGNKGIETVRNRVGDSIRGLLENVLGAAARSLDVNTKIIFKGIKNASLFQSLVGISGISNANAQVANIDMKKLEKGYQSLIDRIKFPEYNNTENRFLRALYSNATQFAGMETQQKDFDRYKSLIKQTSDKLLASEKPTEQREGQLILDQYNEYLAPFDTRESFENNFKNKQPKNTQVVDFFREQFNGKLPEMKLNTLIYGGKNLREVNNYLPMAWKQYSGTSVKGGSSDVDLVNPVFDFDPETGDVSERQSSTTIERTNKKTIKDTDRVLNMDFDRYIFDKYREMNYDIRTLKDRHLYNSIKDQKGFKDVVGSQQNANILTTGVRDMVKRQMGQGYNNSEVMKSIITASNVVAAKGVRQALFGVTQVLKQYPSVALRTMINLNTDVGLFFRGVGVGMNNPIFDNFGIGLRGSTRGGTNYELELNKIRKSDFSSSPGKLVNAINQVSKLAADKVAKPLSWSDEAVAKHSWIAYYMKHVNDNGGDASKIDWETEHLNPNQEAGAYADLLVSTTQAPNDPSKGAALLYDEGDAKTIVRNIIAPFSSFARNAQANLEADLRTFSGGTVAEKRAAAVGILAVVSEQVAFNATKVILATALIKPGSAFIQSLFGSEEPEEKKEHEDPITKIIKNSAADVLFGGFGQAGSYLAIKGVNQVDKLLTGRDKDLFYQYNPGQYGEPDFGIAGIYGILPQNLYNAAQKFDYIDGILTEKYTSNGKRMKSTVELDPKDQALVSMLFFIDALSIAGISDADLSRLNQTIFRDIKKRTSPVKRFTVESKNKKSGAEVERIDEE